MTSKNERLQKIARELLEKYVEAQETVICEFSYDIEGDNERLQQYKQDMIQQIKEATLTEIPKPKKSGRPLGSRTRKKVSREKIQTLIKQKKINAATLEKRTGYTKDYILHCIYHELMSPDMISGVARCLGVDPAELEAKA